MTGLVPLRPGLALPARFFQYPKNVARWSVVRTTWPKAALTAWTVAGSPAAAAAASANRHGRGLGALAGRAVETAVTSATSRGPSPAIASKTTAAFFRVSSAALA